jgi:hypothetical protein
MARGARLFGSNTSSSAFRLSDLSNDSTLTQRCGSCPSLHVASRCQQRKREEEEEGWVVCCQGMES